MISQRTCFLSVILVSQVVLASCGGGTTAAPAAPTSAPAAPATSAPAEATAAPEPTPTSAPAATPTPVSEKVTFQLVRGLSTIEEMDDDIAPKLEQVDGILRVSGTEVSITITYDPEIITPEELRAKLAEIGHAVKE